MLQIINFLTAFTADRDEKGATATEYALIIAGIAVAIVGAISVFGGELTGFWNGLGGQLGL
ncbi:Flp family type IVb pilin [Aeromicrobium duanguangcaii]|uniref:Flp family type IVb pilin n=1 Tax=Aeromicrobium duanguangcaii TaxID=2968086 RepID=A0ABY5KDP6_9ACTN|nr:Flp family type IVb pilin [Aeromicrobium duanguangcaii]MCD9154657.1 Flp family type IVb pilin [Aeromicrobium duanguangcaii]UUI67929.1 Flp family type IVb pilin [Aeromicrobium duanguangcaii]